MGTPGPRMRALVSTLAVATCLMVMSLQPAAAHGISLKLVFISQPTMSGVGLPIQDAQGGPIKVGLQTSSGTAVRIAGLRIKLAIEGTKGCITDNVARTGRDGVATFRPVVTCEGFGLRLKASALETAWWHKWVPVASGAPSNAFDVLGSTPCGAACEGSARQGGTQAQVTATQGNHVLLSVGGPALECAGYAPSSEPVTFLVTESTSRTTVRITLERASKHAKKYEVCFSSPESSFKDKRGKHVATGQAGLLKDCGSRVKVGSDPCVVSRTSKHGAVVVVFSVPPGDPRGVI